MRIAIMGAGVAGLSCAFELEKYGIRPDIYEVQDTVGGRGFNHTAGWMNIMYRPITDAIAYLKTEYGIVIKPMERVTRVNFYSKNNSASMTGNMGYIVLMGSATGSVYNQLLDHIRSPVKYGQVVNFRQLSEDYDHVVVANGTPDVAAVTGNWQLDIAGYIKGATVTGQFDPQTIVMWFNTDFCQRAYGYFVPWNDHKGSLILNMQEAGAHAAAINWKKFLDTIDWDIEILEEYETQHHIGHVHQYQFRNMIFTGLAGGFLDPLFAFGQIASVASGAAAAKAIVEGEDFDQLIKLWTLRNQRLRTLRRYLDNFTDDDFDKAMSVIKTPFFRTLAARSNVNMVWLASKLTQTVLGKKIDQYQV